MEQNNHNNEVIYAHRPGITGYIIISKHIMTVSCCCAFCDEDITQGINVTFQGDNPDKVPYIHCRRCIKYLYNIDYFESSNT